ncbi:protein-glutamate methylesterase/protein-glutamine glutaminase [Cellulomonas soli]|uniref:Protein-glutamate methylesterase/protein-glutamine glutaminase n=1 Tax=Cellulomonas soli TaxID=931535 RepID=A0A512PGN8_9CELL|nr:chemotaxis response regulator protein-glutamate methylesterase [Cellulomonas soli]NYI59570.1 two-component system chemotaxis response regulator CheB [Cellulomonas soli]GEP70360.1 chemotaxis response regulator protein-glutamate methylesterase [Cellulomonas soli]
MTRIRVLVVDDSVVVRRLVTDSLARDPQIEVVGVAANGKLAQSKVEQLAPDLITMDVEMPEMNGIEAVRALRRAGHTMPIIMFSTLTERGAEATLDALVAGATDYVTKPANVGSVQESMAQVADNLLPKIKALVSAPSQGGRVRGSLGSGPGIPGQQTPAGRPAGALAPPPVRAARVVTTRQEPPVHPLRLAVLGSSTGGPEALSKFFTALNQPLPVPLLVTQHMPPVFTRQLAARLDRLGPARVHEAGDGVPLQNGHVYIAPGDRHLEVRRAGAALQTQLTDGPPVNYCRPSVDVLFRSAVRACGGDLLAVVLTGMGADGRTGCEDVVTAGGLVLVQDEPTSVVWGMPGAVATAGLAHRILPLPDVAPTVERVLHGAAVSAGGGPS